MKVKTWLKNKRTRLRKQYEEYNDQATKLEEGISVPYGRDFGASMHYVESQLDLINDMLKRIDSGVLE